MLTGVTGSELTGLAFDPSGTRLYVASQRNPGRVYEIRGPFPGFIQRFEESAPGLTYNGSWSTWTHAAQSGGAARFTATAGSIVTAAVRGPSFTWIGQRGPSRGRAEVWIDGVLWETVDTYSPTFLNQRALFSTSELSPGDHTASITYVGANPAATGTPGIVIDAVEAVGLGAGTAVQRFEEHRIIGGFAGTWFTWNHASQSGGAAQVGSAVGSSLTVTIDGPVFRLIGQRGPARARAEVTIDGASQGTVDTHAPTYASQQVLFALEGMTSGRHTVTVTITGANPVATGTPALVVDAIEAVALL